MLRSFVAVLAVLLLTGCRAGPDQQDGEEGPVTVTGEFGSVPVVTFEAPLDLGESAIEVLIEGDGRELRPGGPVLLALTAYGGNDGTILAERGAGAPRNLLLTRDDVGDSLYDVLTGAAEGSRLLTVQPVDEDGAEMMLVVVLDVLRTRAHGEAVEPPNGVPVAGEDDAGVPTVTVPEGLLEPTELGIVPLIRGEGPQVMPGQEAIVQYTAWYWDDGTIYDSTWEDGAVPASVAIDGTFPGLRDGVIDQRVGSRVMLLIPPARAIGTDSLVMIVDILAATGEGEVEEAEG
ncbi:MAG: FKBP-type peptidyl-prolyl cis-trans isomerase [Actinomycetota bacterium]